jgi:hypothetical protein
MLLFVNYIIRCKNGDPSRLLSPTSFSLPQKTTVFTTKNPFLLNSSPQKTVVYHSLSQFTTEYSSLPQKKQYTTKKSVYHRKQQFTTENSSLPQKTAVYHRKQQFTTENSSLPQKTAVYHRKQ